ncbi:MAG TPA: enoyl-CoA hydratase/isomerase family protein, partial [Myxococcota bacterium]|nr:enoyl-CoA hydratase/isomerase family protein [Myxococcota bacterium]
MDEHLAEASRLAGEHEIAAEGEIRSGGTWLLPRLVGLHRAKELVFLGEWFAAPDAAQIGLVN